MTRLSRSVKRGSSTSLKYFILIVLSIGALFPMVWMVLTSIKSQAEVYAVPPVWWPGRPTLEHYAHVLESNFMRSVLNSTLIALAVTACVVVLASLAAYGFTRYRFRGHRPMLLSTLLGHFVPEAVRFLPLYVLLLTLRLHDTHQGLSLSYIAVLLPIAIWMLTGYFEGIPRELDEAATIDGCCRVGVLTRIILPLAAPGMMAVAVFSFIWAWQEFLFALVLINSPGKLTISLALSNMLGLYLPDWGPLMAATTITVLPTTIIFVVFQKWLVSGLTKGAIKG